jgi:hypothetical protein
MASPHRPEQQDPPLHRRPEPDDLHDHTLWALAAVIAGAHRTGADGLCTNLRCHGQRAPCGRARTAHVAAQLARRAPASSAPPRADRHPARGHAAVFCGPSGFAGLLEPPEPTAAVDATTDPTVFAPFRRPLAAAQPHQEDHP